MFQAESPNPASWMMRAESGTIMKRTFVFYPDLEFSFNSIVIMVEEFN